MESKYQYVFDIVLHIILVTLLILDFNLYIAHWI